MNYVVWYDDVVAFLVITRNDTVGYLVMEIDTRIRLYSELMVMMMGRLLRTSVVAGPLPLAHDFVEGMGTCGCRPIASFLVIVPRGSSAWSRFLFFGAGATGTAEEVEADSA